MVGLLDGVEVLAADELPVRVGRGLAGQDRPQRASLHGLGHGQPGVLQQRGCDVGQFDQGAAAQTGLDLARQAPDQRHAAQAVEEAAALLREAVVTGRLAVVAGEDDDGALGLA